MFFSFHWFIDGMGYAASNSHGLKNRKRIHLHRLIIQPPPGKQVDHINRNRLDNRRENLRIVSCRQNVWNQGPFGKTSKFKGVYWNSGMDKWVASIRLPKDGKQKHLGCFIEESEAALAYNKKAEEFYGEFAYLNKL